MKRFFLLPLMALLSVAFVACTDEPEPEPKPEPEPQTGSTLAFSGTLVVQLDDTYQAMLNLPEFTLENLNVDLVKQTDGSFWVMMHKVTFVPMMPKINMAIPDITINNGAFGFANNQTEVYPYLITPSDTIQRDDYSIANLSGSLSNDSTTIDVALSVIVHSQYGSQTFPLTYQGQQL